MGRRGPAPVPTATLQARGSRKGLERPPEVQFPAETPPCPEFLTGEGKAEWERVVAALAKGGILALTDGPTLACYCEAWGEFAELKRLLKGADLGAAWRLVKLKNAAAERVLRLAHEFGFSPSARVRIKAPEAPPEETGKSRFFAS